jgi:sporulation protein YlmC with PRC-barrel domain
MSDTRQFMIGNDVWCDGEVCGKLLRVVVEPIDRVLTHLVVEPKHGRGAGHLVPIALVAPTAETVTETGTDAGTGAGTETTGIQLSCTAAEFALIEDAEETQFLPGAPGGWDYDQEQMVSWPYYGTGVRGGVGIGSGGMGKVAGIHPGPKTVTHDRVPVGEVQVRRGEHVHATDGAIGRVQGLVVDRADHHVTHVLLDEGHLWGQKTVAIPIGAVSAVEDGVQINLTKDQVRDLPPVDLADSE